MSIDKNEAGGNRPQQENAVRDLGGLAIAAGLLLLAILIAWDATGYPFRRSYAGFGPEIFPYMVAAGLAIFGGLTVLLALRNDFPEREEMVAGPVAWVTGSIVMEFILLTVGAGFVLSSGTLFGLAARGMGRKPVWLTIAVGVVLSALLYVLFRHGLGLSLPAGPLERIIDSPFRR